VTGDVLHVVLLLLVIEHLLPQRARLNEVGLGNGGKVAEGGSGEVLVVLGELVGVLLVGERLNRRGVVGTSTLVVEGHRSVALKVGGSVERRVDGELSVVGSETVAVRRNRVSDWNEREGRAHGKRTGECRGRRRGETGGQGRQKAQHRE
jgi:hypothetical protein